MNQALSRRTQSIIIAIILLLHGTMLVILFIAQMQQENQRHEAIVMIDPDEFMPAQNKTELDWVAVHDALPTPPAQQQVQVPKLDPVKPLTLDAFPALSAQAAPPKDAPLDKQIDQAMEIAQQLLQEQEEKQAAAQEKQDDQKLLEKETVADNEIIEKRVAPGTTIEIAQAKPAQQKSAPEKKVVEKKIEPQKEPQSQPQQLAEFTHKPATLADKKNLSLAQLTQGFVGHLEQAAMAVKSNKTGAASAEQLKQLHFCQKIIGCVVNSYKIHRYNTPHNKEMGAAARIQLVLNENGSIHSLQLHKSSGNAAIDKFLLDIFNDASSSFPPVPASFNQKTYSLPIFNIDRLEAFQSSQGWYIDNKIS